MITQKELKEEIKRVQKQKVDGDFYDAFDKHSLFGYLHALLFVDGKLKKRGGQ